MFIGGKHVHFLLEYQIESTVAIRTVKSFKGLRGQVDEVFRPPELQIVIGVLPFIIKACKWVFNDISVKVSNAIPKQQSPIFNPRCDERRVDGLRRLYVPRQLAVPFRRLSFRKPRNNSKQSWSDKCIYKRSASIRQLVTDGL